MDINVEKLFVAEQFHQTKIYHRNQLLLLLWLGVLEIWFIPFKILGLTSNIMSLGGIAIAIGAMVDSPWCSSRTPTSGSGNGMKLSGKRQGKERRL